MKNYPRTLRPILVTAAFALLLASFIATHGQQRDLRLSQTPSATSAKRTALVIGNGAYTSSPLKNPPNDATDMAAALSKVGFTVEHGINLTQRQMKAMIREFGQKLKAGGQGLFFFAGHGIQMKGRNYLIPVDAVITSEADVEDQGVDASLVMGLMDDAGNALNVVILDACRNNPFARSFRSATNGLAQMDAPSGTLIAYATAPGSVASDGNARNGLYTQELLKFMKIPDLSIEEVFKQVRISVRNLTQNKPNKQTPWEASSLVGDFYFIRSNAASAKAPRPSEAVNEPVASVAESNANAFISKVTQLFDKKAYDEVIQVATEAIKLNPLHAEAYSLRGQAYFHKNDYDTAIVDLTEAIRLNSQDARAYKFRGGAYQQKGDAKTALPDLSEAIRLNPQDADVYWWRGSAQNDPDRAIRDYTEAVRINPNSDIYYSMRGRAYARKGDHEQAIRDLTEAIRIKPGDASYYTVRARYYDKIGLIKPAEADREKARSLAELYQKR